MPRATKAAARPRLGATKKLPKAPTKATVAGGTNTPKGLTANGRRLFERLQTSEGGSFSAAEAEKFARAQDAEDKASRARRRKILQSGGPSSEGMMARHASEQSRAAMSSPSQVGGRKVGAAAGGGSKASGPSPLSRSGTGHVNLRGGTRGGARKKGGGSPLVRSTSGAVNLRGGSRGKWKRDMLGRFA